MNYKPTFKHLYKNFRNLFSFLIFFFVFTASSDKNELNFLTEYLDNLIADKQQFTKQKETEINDVKRLLSVKNLSLKQEYDINISLYDKYKKFKLDSAIYYMEKNVRIAKKLDDVEGSFFSNIHLATLYSSSGKFLESKNILESIDIGKLSKNLLADYYEAYRMFFEHYGSTSHQNKYISHAKLYRDSLLNVLDTSSYKYRINKVQILIDQGHIEQAENKLTELLDEEDQNTPEYAIITHHLGTVNRIKGNSYLEKKYYSLSAIADITNSIKENASFQRLALIYYQTGDIANAFKYSHSAIEDAAYCNVQFRTAQMSEFYSIINASYREKEAKAKKHLFSFLILISILTIFLILLFVYVYCQMKKLSKIKEELSQANIRFIDLNRELNDKNELLNLKNNQLSNANLVKEQYIAQFFSLCSTYINKIEDYRRSLYKVALNNKMDKLMKMLKSTNAIEDEFDELYQHFDSIFLNLYPTFISEFNTLLNKDEQIQLKPGDILNKELRIYALLKLGITDSAKIATFLRCSISTIYNYRTKIRNKAVISREEFEDMVMNIGIASPND